MSKILTKKQKIRSNRTQKIKMTRKFNIFVKKYKFLLVIVYMLWYNKK